MSRTTPGPAACAVLSALLLTACSPSTTDTGAGVGFTDYNSYIRGAAPQQEPGAGPVTVVPPGGGFDPAAAAAAIDRAEGQTGSVYAGTSTLPPPTGAAVVQPPVEPAAVATDSTNRARGGAPAGIKEESGEMVHSHTGISDEQDFGAVSARETIESDAERIAKNRSEYVVVQPKDLPQRPGDTGPNIVEFALATSHAPGVQMYKRSGASLRSANAACGKFASPDQAQQDFLAKGGPERDRMGVDPDGDGFACSWDPRPFRTALQ